MQKYFDCGIDLGTTNSCLAIPTDGHSFDIIENQQDRMQVTPSAVEINNRGRMTIGRRAYNSLHPEDIAIQFKRQMGTNRRFVFASTGIEKTPEELSSEILKRLRADAEARLIHPVKNAVITVPAAFKTLQTEATNRAAKMAGFDNVILLQEPIAAAMAYGARPDTSDKCWMVFDYGGGTLDVAIITTEDNRLEVVNSEGDNYFGGSDIDRLLFQRIIRPQLDKSGYATKKLFDEQTNAGKAAVRAVLLKCEDIKIELSSAERAVLEMFDIEDDNGNDIEFECIITRRQLEALIEDAIDKSICIARKALQESGKKADQLDRILLVGGSTYIPLVRKKLEAAFGAKLDCSLNPMSVVAAGAAIYAQNCTVDTPDEYVSIEAGHAQVNIAYEPVCPNQTMEIVGRILNNDEVHAARVRIDCSSAVDYSGAIWTSGWVDVIDPEVGLFDLEIYLQPEQVNHFKVFAQDGYGTDISVDNGSFEIMHTAASKIVGAPTATNDIGIKIWDDEIKADVLDILIAKNTPLPVSVERSYRTNKELHPKINETIKIEVYEGSNTKNPEANYSAGMICIRSDAMIHRVPKGTDILITITQDVNRNIHVTGYIDDFDYEIPSQTMRPQSMEDFNQRLQTVEMKFADTQRTINKMRSEGIDVRKMESELNRIKNKMPEARKQLDSDDGAVSHFIDDYYALESEVLTKQHKMTAENAGQKEDEKFRQHIEGIREFGNETHKAQIQSLCDDYAGVSTDLEKRYILNKAERLEIDAAFSNFDWLSSAISAFSMPGMFVFTNQEKARYWISQAQKAMENRNVDDLKSAVIQLLRLLPDGGMGAGIVQTMADLMR